MKPSIPSLLICLSLMFTAAYGQVTQTFDIATFQAPKGWKTETGAASIQFSTQDSAAGTFCLITLYKSIPAVTDSKKNFAAAWETVVKEAVTVSSAPEMQPSNNPEDWALEMGSAPFEKGGLKGVVVLVTVSGYGKMMSAMILTNSQVYEPQIKGFLESFKLSKPVSAAADVAAPNPQPAADGYAFATTNFDDGWHAAIKSDWVEVTKGDTKVLLHYGVTMTDEMRRDLSNSYWNQISANKYQIKNLYQTNYSILKDFPYYFVQADAIEKATGKSVFVSFQVIPKNGTAYCYEIVTPTKNSFSQQFPTIDKIENLSGYNRFPIGAGDLIGTWQVGAGAFTQYYFVSSGNYAGMNITVSNLKYIFASGSSYRTETKAVSNGIYASEKELGKYTVSNWDVSTTDQNGKLSNFSAWFEATKGGRILHLLNKKFSSEHYQLGKNR